MQCCGLYPFDISGIFLEFSICGALQYSYCTCTVPYLDNGTEEITGDKLRWRDVYSSSLGGRGFLNVRTLLDAGWCSSLFAARRLRIRKRYQVGWPVVQDGAHVNRPASIAPWHPVATVISVKHVRPA